MKLNLSNTMKVGFSKIIITPDLTDRKRGLQLAGYSPRELCTGVHDDLFARAVYFEGEKNDLSSHVLMIVCDLLNIEGTLARIVKKKISSILPIPIENIMVSATHTHHGPDYNGMFRPGGHLAMIKGFLFPRPQFKELKKLAQNLVKVAKSAYNNQRKALIGAKQTYIPEKDRIMFNRRDIYSFEKAIYPLTVIKIIDNDKDKGKLMGLILNYACHGTVLPYQNSLITADYVWGLIKALNESYHDENINFLYFNGPCGELNPITMKLKKKIGRYGPSKITRMDIYQQKGTFKDAERIGKTIANHALNIVVEIQCKDTKNIKIVQEIIKIPIMDYNYSADFVGNLNKLFFRIKLKIFSRLSKIGILKSNIFLNVENSKLEIGGYVNTIIQLINIGDILIVTAPGEFFLELGNEVIEHINSSLEDKIPFIIELANDSMGYLYTIDAYLKGGYESSFSIIPLGGRFITMKLKRLISKIK